MEGPWRRFRREARARERYRTCGGGWSGKRLTSNGRLEKRTWPLDLNMIYRGSTRTVVTFGRLAFKFGRGKNGMRCNQHEADLYRRSSARRRSMLCPVLWCSRPAFVSIMRRATTPVTKGALDERKAVAWLEWDYAGPSDDGLPFEWKPSDWGYLDGRVVAVDYAATAEL